MRDAGTRAERSTHGGDKQLLPGSRHWLPVFAALFAALVFVPTAAATLGVVGFSYYFNGSGPGQVSPIRAAAVNHTGAGGVAAGDFYVSGGSGSQAKVARFSADGELKQEFSGAADIVDQSNGNLIAGGQSWLTIRSATGGFLRTLGWDAVESGPDDGGVNAKQKLTVVATGGTFTLCYPFGCSDSRSLVSLAIPYDASAGTIEAEVDSMLANAGADSTVTVTGGPGDATGSAAYEIEFDGGTLAGDSVSALGAAAGGLVGHTHRATVVEQRAGGAPEICEAADTCHQFIPRGGGAAGTFTFLAGFAFAPPGAPNAGNLLAADGGSVDELTPMGELLRKIGWDVVASGPDDSAVDEQQQVQVKATGGKFSLGFDGATTGAHGNGDVANGSTTVSNVSVLEGQFAVGDAITGSGIPSGTTIEAVGAGSITLSQPASFDAPGAELTGSDISFEASPGEVEAALNGLPTIGGVGGSVTVTGGPGDLEGSSPYQITFEGSLAGDELPLLESSTAGLTSTGSTSVNVSTSTNGGAFETCTVAAGDVCQEATRSGVADGQFHNWVGSVGEDSTGAIYTAERGGASARVQKFTPAGSGFTPSLFGSSEVQEVAVNASAGQFRLSFGVKPNGTSGFGDLHAGSRTITNVVTTTGQFRVGAPIRDSGLGGFDFPQNTVIAAVSGNTITMSKPAETGLEHREIYSDDTYTTGDLPYNASAAEIEAALNALPSISSIEGSPASVSVAGAGPYAVTFNGGVLRTAGVPPITGEAGSTPLSGGSGAGANEVAVTTLTEGGPRGTEDRNRLLQIQLDNAGNLFAERVFPTNAATCPDGTPSISESRIEEMNLAGEVQGVSAPCLEIGQPEPGGPNLNMSVDPFTGELYVATIGNLGSLKFLVPGQPYPGGNQVFDFAPLGPPSTLTVDPPSDLAPTSVTLSGEINPNGPTAAEKHPNPLNATYQVELKKAGDSSWTKYATKTPVGHGSAFVPFEIGISGLEPKTTYELRVAAEKLGEDPTHGPIQFVTTLPAAPRIDGLSSENVTRTSADLRARVNPLGTDTSYYFEYGSTPSYGESTATVDIGEGSAPVAVQAHLEGLEPIVYHFRTVATNAAGTTRSADQTFAFYPEPCPNGTARQQTGSGALPDCRAYELVTPANAGGLTLDPGGASSPYASSPSRLSYLGFFGALAGPWNPPNNVFGDNYVATRTSTGWRSRYVGISADLHIATGKPPLGSYETWGHRFTDVGMDKFLEWNKGSPVFFFAPPGPAFGSSAPYLFDAQGNSLGRWPTNLAEVPNGPEDEAAGGFAGAVMPSPDFSHFFFSSANVAFASGGLTSEGGSVYDNNIATGEVSIASKTPLGEPIPREPGDHADDYKDLAAVSTDGSHVLIAATGTGICGSASCPTDNTGHICGVYNSLEEPGKECPANLPAHLYMRVGGAVTYDVSMGHVVHFVGMTANGHKVFFTTDEQLVDDHDASTDLYMWSEETGSVVRISDGAGSVGDTDSCNSEWTNRCNVEAIQLNGGTLGSRIPGQTEFPSQGFTPPSDNSVAADNGDIYFYSPEQFDPTQGVPGNRNLYLYRDGEVQFVASLEPQNPVKRIQVSPDGKHAAFLTASQLTIYDNSSASGVCSIDIENGGQITSGPRCLEMYSYDPVAKQLSCVSCPTDPVPPIGNVQASQNGLFMSNDGRTFFSTQNALVPQDDDQIVDTYEFTEGKARLISSGHGSRSRSTIGEAGLVGVSANGVDAYFSTFEPLVPGDENGQFLRIYDARASGGFVTQPQASPCAAAEECRGSGNPPAAQPNIASTAPLRGGNWVHRRPRHRHPRKKHRMHRHHGKKKHRTGQSGARKAR